MKLSDKPIVPEEGKGCKQAMNRCFNSPCALRNKGTGTQSQPSRGPLSATVGFCDDFYSHGSEQHL